VTSVTSDQPVTEQIKAVCADLRQLISSARRKGNLGVANQGLKNLTAALETLGKLTGELAAGTQVAVGVNVSVRAAWEGCDPAVLRWALARHVRAMLTFEPAALNNLELLSAGPCPQCQRYGCPHDHL
jgi:hypothetical protein